MKEIGDNQIPNSKFNSNGFTLIEIISVLVIIGILSAVIIPRMTATDVYDVMSETQILKTHLRYAQFRAMSDTDSWGIEFSGNSYKLLKNESDAPTHLLSDEEIEYALEEAQAHAEDDIKRREEVEINIGADSMIRAAELVMEKKENEISHSFLNRIETAILDLKESLAEGESGLIKSRTDELKKLLGKL